MSDSWGDNSVAITYFLLCHPLQLTLCLFTCHSEYYQNTIRTAHWLINTCIFPFITCSLTFFGLKICLDNNTIWVKPICFAFTKAPPQAIFCVKMFRLVCSYF